MFLMCPVYGRIVWNGIKKDQVVFSPTNPDLANIFIWFVGLGGYSDDGGRTLRSQFDPSAASGNRGVLESKQVKQKQMLDMNIHHAQNVGRALNNRNHARLHGQKQKLIF